MRIFERLTPELVACLLLVLLPCILPRGTDQMLTKFFPAVIKQWQRKWGGILCIVHFLKVFRKARVTPTIFAE